VNDILLLLMFGQSLAIGLLVGFERERHDNAKAGLRTFALIAMSGTLFAYLGQLMNASWIVAVIGAVIGGSIAISYGRDTDPKADSGTTTVIAALITFGLGALLWYGHSDLAVALAVATMALLYFRAELHGATRKLSRRDYISFLQFAALLFVLLPILPDRTIDPFDALNPYRIGWLVVLISGVSLAGYVALRIFGERYGLLLAGVFGGLASTTATTLTFSRHARRNADLSGLAARVIIVANLMLFLRLGVFTAVIAPQLARTLAPMLCGGFIAGGIYFLWQSRHLGSRPAGQPLQFDIENPAELRTALAFAALFSLVTIVVTWVKTAAGVTGVYAVAFISGLTDLDAISLSAMRMAKSSSLLPEQVIIVIATAMSANFIFKFGIAVISGSRGVATRIGWGFAAMTGGMLAGIGITALL